MKLRKIAAFMLVAGLLSGVSSMAAETKNEEAPGTWCKVGRAVMFYLPNLLADLGDAVSLEFNVGNSFAANIHVTKFFEIGGESTDSYFVANKPRHRFGAGHRYAKMFHLGCFGYEDLYISQTCGSFKDFILKDDEFDFPEFYFDAYRTGEIDLWSVGIRAGLIFGAALDLHFQEFPDFFAGIVFCDPDNDNWK